MWRSVRIVPGWKHTETVVSVPADKSIVQRLLIMSLFCRGETRIEGSEFGSDCISTARAVGMLGAEVRLECLGGAIRVSPSPEGLVQPEGEVYLGNSGTGMRLLSGVVAGYPLDVTLTGDESLMRRPMGRIADPLRRMGAQVDLLGAGERPPVRIRGGRLNPIRYELPVASAQVKSCILLAALFAEGETEVIEPAPSRDHTERILMRWGVPIQCRGNSIRLRGYGRGGPHFPAGTWRVPGDFSSGAYFMALAAAEPGRSIWVRQVGLNPSRIAFLEVLSRMGAEVTVDREPEGEWEPAGSVHVSGQRLRSVEVSGEWIPRLIDELPLLIALGTLAEGHTIIRDARELRVKECDRIAAMGEALRRLGVEVQEFDDGMQVSGPASFTREEVVVDSQGDHRIAMSLAVLASYAKAPVVIRNAACSEISCPGFWELLSSCGVSVEDAG